MAGLSQVNVNDTFTPTTINQMVNILMEPSGAQETGHYEIEGNIYSTSSSFLSAFIFTLSRTSVPVSSSVDQSDDTANKLNSPQTGHLTAGGMQVYAGTNATGTTGHVGGIYTVQY